MTTTRTTLGVYVVAGTSLIALCAVNAALSARSVFMEATAPIAPDSLSIDPGRVDFGELRPREVRKVQITLRNHGTRSLHLLPPTSGCGCVSLGASPPVLPPESLAELKFALRAPHQPGPLARRITLQTKELPGHRWHVELAARVVRDIYAEPPELFLNVPAAGETAQNVVIHHREHVRVQRVIADSDSIRPRLRELGRGRQSLDVVFKSAGTAKTGRGVATIQLLGDSGKTLLRIPVRWQPMRCLWCVPARLRLPHFGREGADFEKTLLVLFAPQQQKQSATIEELVPWARLQKQERTRAGLRLWLRFVVESMPDVVDHDVLRVALPGEEPPVHLRAVGNR